MRCFFQKCIMTVFATFQKHVEWICIFFSVLFCTSACFLHAPSVGAPQYAGAREKTNFRIVEIKFVYGNQPVRCKAILLTQRVCRWQVDRRRSLLRAQGGCLMIILGFCTSYTSNGSVPGYTCGSGTIPRRFTLVCMCLFKGGVSPIAALLHFSLQQPTSGQNFDLINSEAIYVRKGKSPSLMSMNYSASERRVTMAMLPEGMNVRRRLRTMNRIKPD